jgi:hypothetical protein
LKALSTNLSTAKKKKAHKNLNIISEVYISTSDLYLQLHLQNNKQIQTHKNLHSSLTEAIKSTGPEGQWWLMPVILATWEAETRRMAV